MKHSNIIASMIASLDMIAGGKAFTEVEQETEIAATLKSIAASGSTAEAHINALINRQGWDDTSRALLLSAFVDELGLAGAFATYLDVIAQEENLQLNEPDFATWEDYVLQAVEIELDCSRSDAQGITMAKMEQMKVLFSALAAPIDAARTLIATNTAAHMSKQKSDTQRC